LGGETAVAAVRRHGRPGSQSGGVPSIPLCPGRTRNPTSPTWPIRIPKGAYPIPGQCDDEGHDSRPSKPRKKQAGAAMATAQTGSRKCFGDVPRRRSAGTIFNFTRPYV
jgi:hypothetical protein